MSSLLRTACFFIGAVCVQFTATAQNCNKPFPQHCTYAPGAIVPNLLTRQAIDRQVTAFYKEWKNRFIRKDPEGNYYVSQKVPQVNTGAYPKGRVME